MKVNKPKYKPTAVTLAVFLGYWAWMYTWDKDWSKWLMGFFLNAGGMFLSLFWVWAIIVPIGVQILVIVDTAVRPRKWYEEYSIGGRK